MKTENCMSNIADYKCMDERTGHSVCKMKANRFEDKKHG